MNRAEAIPDAGSRSTTEPPSDDEPAASPPAPGPTAQARPAGGGNTLAVRPPAPAPSPYRGLRRPDSTPDRLPVLRAEPAVPERWTGPPVDPRSANGAVTRRTGRRRGPVAARRVVGL